MPLETTQNPEGVQQQFCFCCRIISTYDFYFEGTGARLEQQQKQQVLL